MTFEEREVVAVNVVAVLGQEMRQAGKTHEEVVCVLLHAVRLAEQLSASVESSSAGQLRPACVPVPSQVIASCRAELQRRAG